MRARRACCATLRTLTTARWCVRRPQMCVHSLFERLKQLEVTNHKLRAKLSAVTGRSVSSIGRTPTPGGTRPSSRGALSRGGGGGYTQASAPNGAGDQSITTAAARFARAATARGAGGGSAGAGSAGGSNTHASGSGGGGGGGGRGPAPSHPMASVSMPQVMPQPYPMPSRGGGTSLPATQSFDHMGRLAIGPPPLTVHDSVSQLPVSPESSPHPGQSAASARLARLRKLSRRAQATEH